MQQTQNGPNTGGGVRVALAYWLSPSEEAAIAAAVDARLAEVASNPPPALVEARRELDAATVRARWFDTQQAENHRRVARMDPRSIAARLTSEELDALTACDPELVGPLLNAHRQPGSRASAPTTDPEAASRAPIALPSAATGPVLVLDQADPARLTWALGEIKEGTLRTARPDPHHPAWEQACEQAGRHHVDIDTERAARRLVVRGMPALSSLALARPEHRPLAGEAALLRLPYIVAIAPTPLAARIAEYAHPADIRMVCDSDLPAVPGHRSGLTL